MDLSRLTENYGKEVVMLNANDPVSRYYCEKGILRDDDVSNFEHLETCDGITKSDVVRLISEQNPTYNTPLSGDQYNQLLNDLCKVISQCLQSYPNVFSIDKSNGFNVNVGEEAEKYFADGISYVCDLYSAPEVLFETTNVDKLADEILSDDEIELLHSLVNPRAQKGYNPKYREIVKKELKNKQSPVYRILSGNYLREAESTDIGDAVCDAGLDVIVETQNKGICLTESNNNILVSAKTPNGYSIIKLAI
jgi:ferredoxin